MTSSRRIVPAALTAGWRTVLTFGAVLVLLSACSGSGSPDGAAITDTAGVELPDDTVLSAPPIDVADLRCDAQPVEPMSAWPFEVPPQVTVVGSDTDGLTYRVVGITSDDVAVINEVIDHTFVDYETGEPTGSGGNVRIEFSADRGTGVLSMERRDECWTVELSAAYVEAPHITELGDPTIIDPLDDLSAVGTGQIVTGRGTFPVAVTECELLPLSVVAAAREGGLTVTEKSPGDDIHVRWTYLDGVVIDDVAAHVLARTDSVLTVVANGSTAAGQETLIIEVTC